MSFSIASLAKPGEEFITQFVVRPDEPGMDTRENAEARLRARYPNYDLRFHYGDLEYAGEGISSESYGYRCTTPRSVSLKSFGGAVFGVPKS